MASGMGPIWRYAGDEASEKAIRHAESCLGVRFPADYRECVREHGGGAPDPSGFVVSSGASGTFRSSVGVLLSLDPQEPENVVTTATDLRIDRGLPEGLVPIINDGSGDYVCLDYRDDPSAAAPRVVFWSKSASGGPEFFDLAATFDEFLRKLEPEP